MRVEKYQKREYRLQLNAWKSALNCFSILCKIHSLSVTLIKPFSLWRCWLAYNFTPHYIHVLWWVEFNFCSEHMWIYSKNKTGLCCSLKRYHMKQKSVKYINKVEKQNYLLIREFIWGIKCVISPVSAWCSLSRNQWMGCSSSFGILTIS